MHIVFDGQVQGDTQTYIVQLANKYVVSSKTKEDKKDTYKGTQKREIIWWSYERISRLMLGSSSKKM